MASNFVNNKKVKLVAANLEDARAYTKASVSKMSQSEFAGKKFGKSYHLYIAGHPKVVNGVVADPSDVVEIETDVMLDNDNVSTELGPWNRLGDVESFNDEIAKPWAVSLARTQEKKIVEKEIFKAMQSVVVPAVSGASGANFKALAKGAAKLRNLALASKLVGFLNPDVEADIAASDALNKFLPSAKMDKIYGENAIGKFGTVEYVESPDLPEVVTGASAATATITLGDAIVDTDLNQLGFAEINKVTGTNLFKGAVFTVAGLKIVDTSGIQTNQTVSIVVLDVNVAGTEGTISPLRITFDGKNYNNPNAWVATGTESLTATYALGTSKTYQICEIRTEDALAFDTYQFDNLPGSDDEMVSTVGGTSVKMSIFGNGQNLNKLVRIDSAYAASKYEPRLSCLIYVEKV